MSFPDYWLARPNVDLDEQDLEPLYQVVLSAEGGWLELPPKIPKWAFSTWLAEEKGLLLHGSGASDITTFEPRTPNDKSPDEFSKQTAVFAASDAIWALFLRSVGPRSLFVGFSQCGVATRASRWSHRDALLLFGHGSRTATTPVARGNRLHFT